MYMNQVRKIEGEKALDVREVSCHNKMKTFIVF